MVGYCLCGIKWDKVATKMIGIRDRQWDRKNGIWDKRKLIKEAEPDTILHVSAMNFVIKLNCNEKKTITFIVCIAGKCLSVVQVGHCVSAKTRMSR